MTDPYDDVPKPIGSLTVGPVSIGCFFFAIPVVALLVAIFVLRWPWWGDVLAPVAVLAIVGFLGNRYDAYQTGAWMRRHPEVMARKPPP